ncbi:MAG: hypothetical protein LUE13_02840 [Akkermansiaceae bacterium]|nr:hypothetical protein [Akkermansiaceae bacterium]
MFHLRGNQRTSGELSRKEGGKIFGSGSRTPISITLLVKKPNKQAAGRARIFYHDIGDYLNREEKLKLVRDFGSILNPDMKLSSITPNEAYDWINQRDNLFESFIPIGDKNNKENIKTFFVPFYSCGVQSNRDSWVYNYSIHKLQENAQKMVIVYNKQMFDFQSERSKNKELKPENFVIKDETQIKWSSSLLPQLLRGVYGSYKKEAIVTAMYRPFCKQNFYFDRLFIHRPYQIPILFPTPQRA